jgi:hypothetical protein
MDTQLRIRAQKLDMERLRLLQLIQTTEANIMHLRIEKETLEDLVYRARYSCCACVYMLLTNHLQCVCSSSQRDIHRNGMMRSHQQCSDDIFRSSIEATTSRLSAVLQRSDERDENWSKPHLRDAMYDLWRNLHAAVNRRNEERCQLRQLIWRDAESEFCLLCGLSGCIYDARTAARRTAEVDANED